MRFKTVVALLFLAGLSYLAINYYRILRKGVGEPLHLFRMPLSALAWMEFRFPNQEELSFYKENGSWRVTDGRRGSELPLDTMEVSLRGIWSAVPDTIYAGWEKWQAAYPGYIRPASTSVRFTDSKGKWEEFGLLRLDSIPGKAWIQFGGQVEIFELDAQPWQLLCRPLSDYSKGQLVDMKIAAYPDSLLYLVPSDSIRILLRFGEDRWWQDSIPLTRADSLILIRYLTRMATLELRTYADSFDETAPVTEITRRLILWKNKKRQVISCFPGTTKEEPFVVHTSARPGAYFRTDSGGLFRDLFLEMDSILWSSEDSKVAKKWK